jgi:plastocyanin
MISAFNYYQEINMKTKQMLALVVLLALVACSPAVAPTPAGTLSPAPIETSTTDSDLALETTPSSSSQVLSGEVEIDIEDFAFNPETVTMVIGTTIKWSNKDTAKHTVTGDDGSWGSSTMNKGDDYSFTFSEVGTYTYHCTFHPSMAGTIIVVSP